MNKHMQIFPHLLGWHISNISHGTQKVCYFLFTAYNFDWQPIQ